MPAECKGTWNDSERVLEQPCISEEIAGEDFIIAEKVYSEYLRIKSMSGFRAVRTKSINGLMLEKTDGVFLYASCESCGAGFLTTVYAVSKGRRCPICDMKVDIMGRQMKMIPGFSPIRKISRVTDKGVIKHCCGKIMP